MKGVNKVILIGRLGKDPEIKYLESGIPVVNFSMATSESWKDANGNKQESTEWHNVVLWRKSAEIAEKYLRKGSLIYLEGKLTTESWDKNGEKRYTTKIVGNTFQMLDKKGDNAAQPTTATVNQPAPEQEEVGYLPF